MQQLPDPINTQNIQYSQYPQSTRRTQPALPGVTLPTAPVVAPQTPVPPFYSNKKGRKRIVVGRTLLQFFLAGVLIEVAYLGLYPLLARTGSSSDAQQSALLALFPWIPKLYWSNAFPFISPLLSAMPLLNPANPVGNTNLQLLLLSLASLGVLLAFVAGRRVIKARLTAADRYMLLWTILLFTVLFGITLLFAPVSLNVFSQDTLLYGLYGRVVVFYHVNPYVVAPLHSPAAAMHDSLSTILGIQATSRPTQAGPVWTDLSLLVTLLTGNSVANTIIDFRLMGLIAHIVNVVLLWAILTKIKPETPSIPITATLFYAWNPLVLLYSVPLMHLDVVVVMLLLLAVLFYQRSSPLLGWVFALLAALINPLCLLLLPIFFRFMLRELRMQRIGGRMLWWMGMFCISALVFVLAYAPYWQNWGITGMLDTLRQTFVQDTANNSLDAALVHLPVQMPSALLWMINPAHWAMFALGVVGLFLLFGLWMADTLELVLLFNGWLLLLLVILLPAFWPWYLLPPLAFALCATHRHTFTLLLLLCLSGLFIYYSWLWPTVWAGLGLLALGGPFLLWGWLIFFTSTWQMTSKDEAEQPRKRRDSRQSVPGFSRPSWLSRPSRPGRSRF